MQNIRISINCAKKTFSTNTINMSSDDINTKSNLKDVAYSDVGAVHDSAKAIGTVRNVQTQHGDYRSVDEENIVVLRVCNSPVPIRAAKLEDGVSEDAEREPGTEQVVWIEPFAEVRFFFVHQINAPWNAL